MKNFASSLIVLALFSTLGSAVATAGITSGKGTGWAIQSRHSLGPIVGGKGTGWAIQSRHAVGPIVSGKGTGFAIESRHAIGAEMKNTKVNLSNEQVASQTIDLNEGF